MRRAAILGLGQLCAAGPGLPTLERALKGQIPAPELVPIDPADPLRAQPVLRAGCEGLEELANPRLLRRLDAFAQKTLYAGLLAVRDAQVPLVPEQTAVVVATGYGPLGTTFSFLDDIIKKGDNLGSPITFASSVHNAPAFTLSQHLETLGPSLTLTSFGNPWLEALVTAIDWLSSGDASHVILASADEFHPVIGYGLPQEPIPGETFSAMVLAREPHCTTEGWGWVSEPQEGLTAGNGPLFVDPLCGSSAPSALAFEEPVGHYAPLWGRNPTSFAHTVVAGLVALKRRCLFDSIADPAFAAATTLLKARENQDLAQIRCLACLDANKKQTVIVTP